jgi:hypothetical protein
MMKSALKTLLVRGGSRSIFVPWAVNVSAAAVASIAKFRTKYSDKNLTYQSFGSKVGTNPSNEHFNDPGLNFFIRLLLEHRYGYLIEIGALSLERSTRVKKLFPDLSVYALDVTQEFRERHIVSGVTLMYNSTDNILAISREAHGRGIICSHGTLAYYANKDLYQLLTTAFEISLDLAIAEPNTIGEESLGGSLKRTHRSWYHPYLPMLRSIGYVLPDGNGQQIRDCWSTAGETRTFIFARARA